MKSIHGLIVAAPGIAFAMADSDNGGGGNPNLIEVDLSPLVNAIHGIEDTAGKTETFIGGIVDKLVALANPPDQVDLPTLKSNISALATELQGKSDELKAAVSAGAQKSGTGPSITSISPTSGAEAGGDSVVITGTNLTGAMAVNFGPAAATTFSIDSDTQITATTPPGTGTGLAVVVQGPVSASNSASFSYTPAAA